MTPRQSSIIELLKAGYTQTDVAAKIDVSLRTVELELENLRLMNGHESTRKMLLALRETRKEI